MADAGGILRTAGEGVGSFLAGIPPALVDFFSGVAAGAGLHGVVDWAAMISRAGVAAVGDRGFPAPAHRGADGGRGDRGGVDGVGDCLRKPYRPQERTALKRRVHELEAHVESAGG